MMKLMINQNKWSNASKNKSKIMTLTELMRKFTKLIILILTIIREMKKSMKVRRIFKTHINRKEIKKTQRINKTKMNGPSRKSPSFPCSKTNNLPFFNKPILT